MELSENKTDFITFKVINFVNVINNVACLKPSSANIFKGKLCRKRKMAQ